MVTVLYTGLGSVTEFGQDTLTVPLSELCDNKCSSVTLLFFVQVST